MDKALHEGEGLLAVLAYLGTQGAVVEGTQLLQQAIDEGGGEDAVLLIQIGRAHV